KELTTKLKAFSRDEGATLFMTTLAAFHLLMSRYSGQRAVVIGADIAGRNHPEIEGLIGFFVNQLPLLVNLKGRPTVREVVRQTRRVCIEAFSNQDVPFERIVEELRPKRDLSKHPLFQVKLS